MTINLYSPPEGITLDAVLITPDLTTRPERQPNYQLESRYLKELASHLADSPDNILEKLTSVILEGVGAGSAGVSLLNDDNSAFYWPAIAGAWSPHVGSGTPRNFGPCGIVLDRDAVQLFRTPELFYPYLQPASPKINEVLLVPFYSNGVAVGTVWAVSHDFSQLFDREDARLLQGLSLFAAAAFQCLQNIRKLKTQSEILREAQERMESTLESTAIGTWIWDVPSNRVFADRNVAKFFSVSDNDAAGGPMEKYLCAIHSDDRKGVEQKIDEAMKSQDGTYEVDYRLLHQNSSIRWVSARGKVTRGASGATRFLGAIIDITDRKAAQQLAEHTASENQLLLTQLKAADRKKDEFLGTLAHELRNPLAPIRNAVQILKKLNEKESKTHGLVDMMDRQVSHMVRLVDDLLDVSRIRWGKIELSMESVSIDSSISEALSLSRPLIDSLKHRVQISLQKDLYVQGDATRLVQVFSNLLNNAAKYTDSGGTIDVTSSIQYDMVEVKISDSGMGISTEMLPEIFDLFTQAKDVSMRSQGGLGIGLSLVKTIVELHKGIVKAESKGLGKGSSFIVQIPLRQTPRKITNSSITSNAVAKRRILVVDDNKDAADSLSLALNLFGMHTKTVYTGQKALEIIDAFMPEIVFLDIGMPTMDGCKVAEEIRSRDIHKDVQLIALTGWGSAEDKKKTAIAGFIHHLTKPVDLTNLRTLLET